MHFKKSVCFSSAVKNATQGVICRPVDACSLSGRAVLLGQRAFQRKRNVWAEWQDDPSEGELSFHYKFGEKNSDKFWSKIKSFFSNTKFYLLFLKFSWKNFLSKFPISSKFLMKLAEIGWFKYSGSEIFSSLLFKFSIYCFKF